MDKTLFTVAEASSIFFEKTISKSSLYKLVQSGELAHLRIGKKILFTKNALREFCEQSKGGDKHGK